MQTSMCWVHSTAAGDVTSGRAAGRRATCANAAGNTRSKSSSAQRIRRVYSELEWMCNYVRLPLTIVNNTATTSTGSSSRAGLHVSTWHVCCGNHLNVRTYYRCEHAMGIRGLQNHILRHWPGWLALLAGLAGWPGWLAGLAGPAGPTCWLGWLADWLASPRLCPPFARAFSPRVPFSCPTRPPLLPHRIPSFLSSAVS